MNPPGEGKAKAIASVKDFQYTIGVDITLNHVGLVYTDLSEEALAHRRIPKPFRNDKQYIERNCGYCRAVCGRK